MCSNTEKRVYFLNLILLILLYGFCQGNGGCSDRAICQQVGPHQRTCKCRKFYVGDGITCIGDISEVMTKYPLNSLFKERNENTISM